MITATLDTSQIGPQAGQQIAPQIASQIASQTVDTAGTAPGKASGGPAQDNAFRAAYSASLGERSTTAESVTENASVSGGFPHPEDGSSLLDVATLTGQPKLKQSEATIQPQSARLSPTADLTAKSRSSALSARNGFASSVSSNQNASAQGAGVLGDRPNIDQVVPTRGAAAPASGSVAAGTAGDQAAAKAEIVAGIGVAAAALKGASGQIASAVQLSAEVAARAVIETPGLASGKAKEPEHAAASAPVGSRKGDVTVSSRTSEPGNAIEARTAAAGQIALVVEPLPSAAAASPQVPVFAAGEQPSLLPAQSTALVGAANNTLVSGLVAEHPGIRAIEFTARAAALGKRSGGETADQPDVAARGPSGPSADGTAIDKPAGDRSDGVSFAGLVGDAATSENHHTTHESADEVAQPGFAGGVAHGGTIVPGGLPTRLPDAGLSNPRDRSVGVSGLVGTGTPGELEGSVRQTELVPSRLAPSNVVTSISQPVTGPGSKDPSVGRPVKSVPAGTQEVGSKTRSIEGFDSSGSELAGGWRALPADGQGAVPDPTKIANDTASTKLDPVVPTAKSPELAHPADRAAAASTEGRARAAKLSGEDRDAATGATSGSSKGADSAATLPSDALRDGANASRAASVITVAAAPLTGVEAAALIAHPGGSSAIASVATSGLNKAGINQAGAVQPGGVAANRQTDTGGGGALSAQPSAGIHAVESQRTLLATPTVLEVGVQSGTQEWLKIRAEVGGQGEVRASLDAASAVGRDLLHSQLPALNAFLHGEQVQVTATLAERSAISEFGTSATTTGTGGSGNAFGASNGQLSQGHGGQQQTGQSPATRTSETASRYTAGYDSLAGVSDAGGLSSGLQAGVSPESGRWLNVRV